MTITLKCGCYISSPNEQCNTIPYFCDSEIEENKGENFYIDGYIAEALYNEAVNGKCLSKAWYMEEQDY